MQNGIYSEEINTSTDIAPNFTLAGDIDELEALKGAKVNYSCDGVEVDLILYDKFQHRHGRRSDSKVQNSNRMKWTRNNIAATMEGCEPIGHFYPTSTCLDYGLAATVVASLKNETDAGKIVNISKVSTNDIEFQGAVGSLNHVYSYTYYEPDVQWQSNISQRKMKMIEKCKNEQIYSGRNLLPKDFRSKPSYKESASLSLEDRHTYTTHYGTTENLYEEVSEKNIRKVLSDNRVSTSANCVKEELLRVQHNHFRVLEELNLSLEALIMPPNLSSNIGKTTESFVHCRSVGTGFSSAVVPSNKVLPQNLTLSSDPNKFPNTSLEDVSETFNSVNQNYNSQQLSNKDEFDEDDLDSGFSGSGISSGASYNESLRHYKTSGTTKTRGNTSTKTPSPSPSIVFTTKNNTTSQQATSAVNKQLCEDLLQRKQVMTSFH